MKRYNLIIDLLIFFLLLGISFLAGAKFIQQKYDTRMELIEGKSTYCEANQIKEFYRLRTYQFHAGEINAQGYKDSLYKDLQTHFILNK